ncbi:hypothetical protein BROUX41_002114 [Berkeleyomyces rouxiae]|uniref:uncharacterized protein n=1 Tax=Berkeleyomyces rouxiae TaxID=2035830 RepID=UPI003B80778D
MSMSMSMSTSAASPSPPASPASESTAFPPPLSDAFITTAAPGPQQPASASASASHRRRLLIVYIHGFYGNDESFRAFPEHVHNHLRQLLRETHIVYSKIYPRYKTYRAIEVGRDIFSTWLAPHVADGRTDVVLVGHSMGGILAAEVALLTSPPAAPGLVPRLKHNILGIVALDTPFLGLHPRIIVAGISSLFLPAPPPDPVAPPASPTPASGPPQRTDTSIFNPSFINDVHLKARPFTQSLAHFARKHKPTGLLTATKTHVISHLEYVSCLVDQHGLRARYARLSALAAVDVFQHPATSEKVAFANYYTTCHGRHHRSRSRSRSRSKSTAAEAAAAGQSRPRAASESPAWLPASALLRRASDESLSTAPQVTQSSSSVTSDSLLAPPPAPYSSPAFASSADAVMLRPSSASSAAGSTTSLASYADTSFASTSGPASASVPALYPTTSAASTTSSAASSIISTSTSASASTTAAAAASTRPPHQRKFCLLPDPLPPSWVRVHVEDTDEVGAHCGIFLAGRHYEPLVGDVAERIASWVEEDLSQREILRMGLQDQGIQVEGSMY